MNKGFVAPAILVAMVVMGVVAAGLTLSVKYIGERQQTTSQAEFPDSCQGLNNPNECTSIPGCYWEQCQDCRQVPVEACSSTFGCALNSYSCEGLSQGACNDANGCNWDQGQMANCYLVNNDTACNHPNCTYIPGEASECTGYRFESGGSCSGPGMCSTYGEKPICQQAGCTWTPSYTYCASFTNPFACNQTGHCSWEEGDAQCQGQYPLIPPSCNGVNFYQCDNADFCATNPNGGRCSGNPQCNPNDWDDWSMCGADCTQSRTNACGATETRGCTGGACAPAPTSGPSPTPAGNQNACRYCENNTCMVNQGSCIPELNECSSNSECLPPSPTPIMCETVPEHQCMNYALCLIEGGEPAEQYSCTSGACCNIASFSLTPTLVPPTPTNTPGPTPTPAGNQNACRYCTNINTPQATCMVNNANGCIPELNECSSNSECGYVPPCEGFSDHACVVSGNLCLANDGKLVDGYFCGTGVCCNLAPTPTPTPPLPSPTTLPSPTLGASNTCNFPGQACQETMIQNCTADNGLPGRQQCTATRCSSASPFECSLGVTNCGPCQTLGYVCREECLRGGGTPSECQGYPECPQGYTVNECTGLTPGDLCVINGQPGRCVDDDENAQTGLVCKKSMKGNGESCVENYDCASDNCQFTAAMVKSCVPPGETVRWTGETCGTGNGDAICAAGLTCTDNVCQLPRPTIAGGRPAGSQCTASEQCESGICNFLPGMGGFCSVPEGQPIPPPTDLGLGGYDYSLVSTTPVGTQTLELCAEDDVDCMAKVVTCDWEGNYEYCRDQYEQNAMAFWLTLGGAGVGAVGVGTAPLTVPAGLAAAGGAWASIGTAAGTGVITAQQMIANNPTIANVLSKLLMTGEVVDAVGGVVACNNDPGSTACLLAATTFDLGLVNLGFVDDALAKGWDNFWSKQLDPGLAFDLNSGFWSYDMALSNLDLNISGPTITLYKGLSPQGVDLPICPSCMTGNSLFDPVAPKDKLLKLLDGGYSLQEAAYLHNQASYQSPFLSFTSNPLIAKNYADSYGGVVIQTDVPYDWVISMQEVNEFFLNKGETASILGLDREEEYLMIGRILESNMYTVVP